MKKMGFVFTLVLMSLFLVLSGCEKKSAGTDEKSQNTVAVSAIEQTTCPVMGGAINKQLYTEYQGKKVYFCCAGCKEKFEKEPEKYLDKLPQFEK